nr:hypothetical protein [Tanacetum cinerariifolium]
MLKQRDQAVNMAVQKKQEEQASQSFTPYWNFSMIDDEEVLQAREKFMKSLQTFLQKFSRYPFGELSEFTNSSNWDRPMIVDDKEHSIQFRLQGKYAKGLLLLVEDLVLLVQVKTAGTKCCCWVIEGVVHPVALTTAEQRLARKNELKAKVYNPQLDNDDLKQIDADDLEEMDLKWRGHFTRECRSPKDNKRNVPMETQKGMYQWRLLCLMHWFHSVMVWEAMTKAFRQKKNQPTMPSWHSPPQALPVLIMR